MQELSGLLKIAERCLELTKDDNSPRVRRSRDNIQQIITRIQSAKLRVGVIGEFKAGKSTLMNAILGKNVLPMAVQEATALPVHICYGEKEEFIGICKDGREDAIEKTRWSEIGTLKAGQIVDEKEKYLELKYMAPLRVLERKVDFYDCPGLGSSLIELNSLTRNFITKMDAALFVMRICNNALSQSETRILRDLLGANQFAKILFVVNGIDELRKDRDTDYEEQISNIRCKISEITEIDNPRISFMSAKEALDYVERGEVPAEDTGFKGFQCMLEDLFDHARGILERNLSAKLSAEVKSLVDDLEAQVQLAETDKEKTHLYIERLERTIQSRNAIIDDSNKELNRVVEDWISGLDKLLEELCCRSKERSRGKVYDETKKNEAEDWIKAELNMWIEEIEPKWIKTEGQLKDIVISQLSILRGEYADLLDVIREASSHKIPDLEPVTIRCEDYKKKNLEDLMEDDYEYGKQAKTNDTIAGAMIGTIVGCIAAAIFPPFGILGVMLFAGGGAIVGREEMGLENLKVNKKQIQKSRAEVDFDSIFDKAKNACCKNLKNFTNQQKKSISDKMQFAISEKLGEMSSRIDFLKNKEVDLDKTKEQIGELKKAIKE